MGEGLLQPMHLLVIGLIVLLLFGPNRLPEVGRGLGQAIRGFKDAMREADSKPPSDQSQLPK